MLAFAWRRPTNPIYLYHIFIFIVTIFTKRKSAPKFLLDVYKNLNDEANESANGGRHPRSTELDEGENFITDVDKVAIEQSDIITTFLNKSEILV